MTKSSWKKVAASVGLAVFFVAGIVFVSRFYMNKDKNTVLLNNANSPSIQIHTNSEEEKVFSRSEMQSVIEGFGVPSEEDIRVFQEDPRYEAFSRTLENSKEIISQEVRNELMQNAYLSWFQQDSLNQKYESGELSMDGFTFGLNVIIKIGDDFVKEKLTNEQYFTLMGQSKADLAFDVPDFSDSTHGYSEITSLFPAIRNGEHPEIQSAEDLYKVVPKEAIEKIKVGSRERLRIQRESTRAFRLGKILQKEYDEQTDVSYRVMRDAIKSAVTPKQEIFLFGYEF